MATRTGGNENFKKLFRKRQRRISKTERMMKIDKSAVHDISWATKAQETFYCITARFATFVNILFGF